MISSPTTTLIAIITPPRLRLEVQVIFGYVRFQLATFGLNAVSEHVACDNAATVRLFA